MRAPPPRCCSAAWRLLSPLLLPTALGCSPPAHVPVTDFDSGWTSEPDPGAPPPAAPRVSLLPEDERPRWRHAGELAAMTLLPGRGPSEHLGGDYAREVLVNALAQAYADTPATARWPAGAIIAQRHLTAGPDVRAVGYFVMERAQRGGGAASWRYLVLDTQLRVATATSPDSCRRCHLDAPGDGVFGPPPPP